MGLNDLNNNILWNMRFHDVDTGFEDDDGRIIQRGIPALGKPTFEHEGSSAGGPWICTDTDPDETYNGGGTWVELQMGGAGDVIVAVDQGGAVTIAQAISGARKLIQGRTSSDEAGLLLLNLTIEIETNASAGDIVVTLDTDEVGWEWYIAASSDFQVGTFRIPGQLCGFVYAVAASSPIQLRLVDANDDDAGDTVTLTSSNELHIEGQCLYWGQLS